MSQGVIWKESLSSKICINQGDSLRILRIRKR